MAKKTDEKPVLTTKDRLQALLKSDTVAAINKKFGSVLSRASDQKHQGWRRLSSGIRPLDRALGGGFPIGVVNTLYGDKGACKTSTILKTMGIAQKTCRDCYLLLPEHCLVEEFACHCKGKSVDRACLCAFIDVEGTLDLEWAGVLGVNRDQLLLSRPDFAEASLDILEVLIREGMVDVIAMDSLAFLTPKKEIEESTGKDMMGVQARAIAKGIRKLTAAQNMVGLTNGHDRRPTILFTNQIRMNLGVMFGNPETTAGGKSPGYSAVTEIKIRPGKYVINEETGFPISAPMLFRVEKNKSYFNKIEGEFSLCLSPNKYKTVGDTHDEAYLIERGQIDGVVTRKGMTWSCLGKSFGKREDLLNALIQDKGYEFRVWKEIMKYASVSASKTLPPVDTTDEEEDQELSVGEAF